MKKGKLQNNKNILIYSIKYSSVYVRVCVCETNTNIMVKD